MIDKAGPWGTGPFVLQSGASTLEKRAPELILEPNANYWNPDRRPKARFVFDNVIPKAEALKQVMSGRGKVDIVTELTPAEAGQVEKSMHARLVRSNAKTVLVGVFNQQKGKQWTESRLRKAVNHAINRRTLVKNAAGGYGVVTPAIIRAGEFGYNASLEPYRHDPEAAKSVFREGGLKEVTIIAGEGHEAVAEAVAADLKAVGVNAKTVTGGPEGEWDIWLVEHFDWSPEFPGGVVYREFFGQDGAFRKMEPDPQLEGLFVRLAGAVNKSEQEKLIMDMEKRIHDEALLLFLYAPAKLYAVSNRVDFVPYETTMLELAETSARGR